MSGLSEDVLKSKKIYVSEAEFFEKVITPDLACLPKNSHVIEIGAGIGLLALKIAERGFEVTAFEPQSGGFSNMHEIRNDLISNWSGDLPKVNFYDTHVDASTKTHKLADYIFAMNVIEHVPDYLKLIDDVLKLKTSRGILRLICPNYAIPYEPHFEIPIIISKKLTERIFKKRIRQSALPYANDMWRDLSWPSQRRLNKSLKAMNLKFEFSRDATNEYINRALNDSGFILRKGRVIGNLIKCFALLAKYLTRFIPISLIPIIDCRIFGTSDHSQ